AVWRILRRGLARSPSDRWPDMTALLDALAAVPRRRRQVLAAGLVAPTLLSTVALAAFLREPEPDAVAAAPAATAAAPTIVEPTVELARGPGRGRPGTGARLWIGTDELRFSTASDAPSQPVSALADGHFPESDVRNHLVVPLHAALGDG